MNGRKTWSFQVGNIVYRIGNIRQEDFERFIGDYIEHEISQDSVWPFLKRWINEDENEWTEMQRGERKARYPDD